MSKKLRMIVAAVSVACLGFGCGQAPTGKPANAAPLEQDVEATTPSAAIETAPPQLTATADRTMDPERGRALFLSKGCVLCHAVNGVGGKAAPSFDAGPKTSSDPLDFAMRMWRGAPAMVSLQRIELGYQIDLSGQDLADLAAFAADPQEQLAVTEDLLPEGFSVWLVDERFWDNDEWSDYLELGEGFPDLSHFDRD